MIARRQLELYGWTDLMIRTQLRADRWRLLFRGGLPTTTGNPPVAAWWWAAHLLRGDRSHLLGESALNAGSGRKPQLSVMLGVPWNGIGRPSDVIEVSSPLGSSSQAATRLSPAERPAYAIIDATQTSRSRRYVEQPVTDACQRRLATPSDIRKAMNAHRRVRFRSPHQGPAQRSRRRGNHGP